MPAESAVKEADEADFMFPVPRRQASNLAEFSMNDDQEKIKMNNYIDATNQNSTQDLPKKEITRLPSNESDFYMQPRIRYSSRTEDCSEKFETQSPPVTPEPL